MQGTIDYKSQVFIDAHLHGHEGVGLGLDGVDALDVLELGKELLLRGEASLLPLAEGVSVERGHDLEIQAATAHHTLNILDSADSLHLNEWTTIHREQAGQAQVRSVESLEHHDQGCQRSLLPAEASSLVHKMPFDPVCVRTTQTSQTTEKYVPQKEPP
eukprot:2632519-Rhodomonas_salina.2